MDVGMNATCGSDTKQKNKVDDVDGPTTFSDIAHTTSNVKSLLKIFQMPCRVIVRPDYHEYLNNYVHTNIPSKHIKIGYFIYRNKSFDDNWVLPENDNQKFGCGKI